MRDEKDESACGPWDYSEAITKKKTCTTCNSAGGPFMIQGTRQPGTNQIIAAQVCVCENTESPNYMLVMAAMRSCGHWVKREAVQQPKIIVAHKQVPPLTMGGVNR